ILDEAGVLVALTTDHPVVPIEQLPIVGALVVKAGMPEDRALATLTINPARILGLDSRIGSIEAGKDADLVLWSGHPFDVSSRVCRVWVGGEQAL
ncbi:MAG: amidohydrolase family protein, partial [Limnochordia bacterium]